jgi:hypothetical protein
VLKRPLFVAAAAITLAASALAFASCKSNDVTQNNTSDQYDSFVTQTATPDQRTTINGPDGSKVVIEAHALATTTDITIGKMKAGKYPDLPSAWASSGGVYSFEPHDQEFAIPVHITVPYTDKGQPIRLVTASPTESWKLVDGVALSGGFVTFDSPHFSFYTVVTGAPIDTTLRDSGADSSIPDATTQDSPADGPQEAEAAAPGSPPIVFVSDLSHPGIFRFFPVAPGVDAGAGASDGGLLYFVDGSPAPAALALSGPPPFLLATIPGPSGRTATFGDPYGAFPNVPASGPIPTPSPGPVAFGAGNLWIANQGANSIDGWAGLTNTISKPYPAAIAALTFDAPSSTLYVVEYMPPALHRLNVPGLTPVNDAGAVSVSGNVAGAATLTPWGELLVVVDGAIHRFSAATLQPAAMPSYGTAIQFMTAPAIGAARWPDGTDEIFIAETENYRVDRYVFATGDPQHATPIANGNLPLPNGELPNGMIIGP